MNNAIDITLENTGVVMEVENFDTENNTILVSLSRNGVDADVDSVAPSITVDFGSLPQNVYWDEIQDKPDFHPVATSGDYDDLENKPNLHQVATTGDYQDLENKPNLSEVATSGDYGDLTGKPKINNVTLDGNKSAADLGLATAAQGAKADTAYQKPVGGIPGSDMSAAVQSALEKAETALQEHQSLEGYATEAWVEGKGYLTEHQDISGKADKSDTYTKQEVDAKMASAMHYKGSVANYDALLLIQDAEVGDMYNVLDTGHNYAWDGAAWDIQSGIVDLSGKQDTLVSGENIKTINGESILGSGNIVIQGGGGTGDYEDLDNLPSINNVELIGNKTASDLGLQTELTIDATPTEGSTNPVQSGGVYDALQGKVDKVQLATTNDIATLGANGNIKDSGISIGSVATDANVVHKSGNETISGEKTFADKTIFNNEVKLIDSNENGVTFYSEEEGKIEFHGSPGSGTVQLKNITSPSDSSDAATKGYVDNEVAGKQDVISDLATIRSGAAAGATAYQKPSTGIPKTDLASGVQTSLGKADTAYQKPSGGIPSSDMTNAVQTSLGKADTALQTETDPTVPYWAKQSTKPSYDYSEIGNTPDLSGFITKNVNDLANYYLKSETYTKTEVGNLIAAINQFHYEIAASTSAVTNPQSNVLYLIGPVGSGSDKYEEYVYPDSTTGWVKIGDTSIDLSGYVTTSALNTALADYTTSDDLATLLAGYQTKIDSQHKLDYSLLSNTPTIPTVPTNVSAFTNDAGYLTQHQDISGKADKVSSATSGNFAALDSNGNLTDSGHKHSDYLTSHQDISGKEDKTNKVTSLSSSSTDTQYPSAKVVYDQLATKQATLVSGTNIKTVNSTSLLGSGNITINDGVGFQTITTQQDGTMVITLTNGDTITVDLNHTHPNYYKKTAETSQPQGGMLPDVIYTLGTLTGATTFTFAAAVSGNLNHYYFTFTSGSTAVVPTWPASITSWDGNCVDSNTGLPVIAANNTYEVSVLDGNAIIKEW